MKISKAFPSEYLRAADLDGRQVTVTMSHVTLADIGGEQKPVLHFAGKDRGLVLNKTNANTISNAYGDDTDNWHGHQIVLFPAMVDFQGRSVEAVRVKIAPRAQVAAPKPAANSQRAVAAATNGHEHEHPGVGVDDEVPF